MMEKHCSLLALVLLCACSDQKTTENSSKTPAIMGTWELVSSKVITKEDTVDTYPLPNQEMIKMFTEKEFAFFKHDTNNAGKDSAVFSAGSGTYTLEGEKYSEHLAYCNYREWENHDFHFNLKLRNDSLIQTGIEKIDSLGIDQEIVEVYVRKK
jgi:hypothetical protein